MDAIASFLLGDEIIAAGVWVYLNRQNKMKKPSHFLG
jgi:hypothetical protein